MPGKLSDRLARASKRLFVGREAQCRLFEGVIDAEDPPFNILHIFGPGGIGKTSLLYEFQHLCREKKVPYTYLDARSFDADPQSFKKALAEAMDVGKADSLAEVLNTAGFRVYMIDTFELMGSLEQWLFSDFFTQLPERAVVVLAGRFPLATTWSNHPGWRSLIRAVSLRNLSSEACRKYLEDAGMPATSHQAVIDFTHGHPLALSLIAESFQQSHEAGFSGELSADSIKVLMDRFVMEAPGPEHRLALEASALVNNLTESLLAALIDTDDARNVFEWLRNLSFMESGARGIFPHDLARDVLNRELRWRNPEHHKLLHERARAFYNKGLEEGTPEGQRLILTDYIFLHRDNPIVQPFFQQLQAQWHDRESVVSSDLYSPNDEEAVVEIVESYEGKEAAVQARHWLKKQPENIVIYRGEAGRVIGFLFLLALEDVDPCGGKIDPVVHACQSYLKKEAPLRPGEKGTLFRFWMDAESHQQLSRVQSHIFVHMVRHYLTTTGLAFSFLPISYPDFWGKIFSYADLQRIPALDFESNAIPFGIFGHDWRRRPPAAWLDLLASRETSSKVDLSAEEMPEQRRIIVLNEEAFEEATRDALRAYTRPHSLKKNPLLSSRIVADQVEPDAGDDKRIEVLMALLTECIDALKNNPREEKAHRAVDRTYVRPAPSQEIAAELLNLPYSTFRRHLTRGVREITSMLWEREIG